MEEKGRRFELGKEDERKRPLRKKRLGRKDRDTY